MPSPLKTHFEVVISFKPFSGLVPEEILREKVQKVANELHGELREVAE